LFPCFVFLLPPLISATSTFLTLFCLSITCLFNFLPIPSNLPLTPNYYARVYRKR
jgi:hypothetical protein